jgi:hypothetical protein
VAELQEPALLDIGILVRVQLARDRASVIESVGKVEPLETAVLERLAGRLGAADRLTEGPGLRSAERLIGVAVVREGPVDADGVGDDLPQHALGDAELGALDCEGALRVEEIVHVRGEPERVGEVLVHRV